MIFISGYSKCMAGGLQRSSAGTGCFIQCVPALSFVWLFRLLRKSPKGCHGIFAHRKWQAVVYGECYRRSGNFCSGVYFTQVCFPRNAGRFCLNSLVRDPGLISRVTRRVEIIQNAITSRGCVKREHAVTLKNRLFLIIPCLWDKRTFAFHAHPFKGGPLRFSLAAREIFRRSLP